MQSVNYFDQELVQLVNQAFSLLGNSPTWLIEGTLNNLKQLRFSEVSSGSLVVDAIGDDDDLSHVYLPNFKQLLLGF